MSNLFSGIFKWLIQKAATLILILAVLLGGAWVKGEWKKDGDYKKELTGLVEKRDSSKRNIEQKDDAAKKSADEQLRRQAKRQKLWNENKFERYIPLSPVWVKIKELDAEIFLYQEAVKGTQALKDEALKAVEEVNRQIAGSNEAREKTFVGRISQYLPIALGILIGIILLPIGIKVLFYFVVAPWVVGCPPIRLLPSASGGILSPSVEGAAGNGRGKMSAVSQSITLGEHQELLIQPDYLQSTSLQARKKTKWFLNASIPFTSLASGMFMLTRVSPAGSESVVISSTKDPLSEVGIINLAEGAAFVCQPRSLAGVIQDRRNPLRITRHWRLNSLQSWLTLQLRFLVFHGPGQLVIKGCRGIQIESAGMGRLINQAATLGFSANLDYANTRCETFVSYWNGKEDLFNDLFKGESGVYVYEEIPDLKRTTGTMGRGLQGLTDAFLKVFGV